MTLRVDLIAATTVFDLYAATNGAWQEPEDWISEGELLAEFAGRACYQSWNRPNPATATNKGYLRHILEVGHLSVLEHANATLYLQGVSRSYTHELVRHRHESYSQLSQRFVDSGDLGYVVPPAMRGNRELEERLAFHWKCAIGEYNQTVELLLAEGKTRKQAREAARAFLPGCAETKIVVTGNLRAWRELISKRATIHADAEMLEVTLEIARVLKDAFPHAFLDLRINPDFAHFVQL